MSKVIVLSPEQAQRAIRLNWMATEIAKSVGSSIRIPTALIGDTGCGKTDSVREFYQLIRAAKSDAKLWSIRLGLRLPEDLGGYPTKENGKLVHLMLGELPFDCDDVGVIFLDEFDRAPMENQNAALPLVYGDEFHGHKISENAYVCLAMNGTADTYTTPLSHAAATRVCSIFVSRHADDGNKSYQEWAARNNIPMIARAYNEYHGSGIKSSVEYEEIAIATPRTVVMAAMISEARKKLDGKMRTDDIYLACIAGVIGIVEASKFIALEELLDSVDVREILSNPMQADIVPESGYLFVIEMAIGAIKGSDNPKQLSGNLLKYIARHHNGELRRIAGELLSKDYPSVVMNREWQTVIG